MKSKIIFSVTSILAAVAFMFSCNKPSSSADATTPRFDHINMMIKDWERAKKYTQAYLDSSNDKSVAYKLSDKTPRTFGQQLLHLAEANYGFGQTVTGKATELGFGKLESNAEIKTKADLTKAVIDSYDYVIAGLKEMNDKQLMDSCTLILAPNFQPKMTKAEMISKAFEHQTHHRGQTTQYLRAQGLTPPQEMLF